MTPITRVMKQKHSVFTGRIKILFRFGQFFSNNLLHSAHSPIVLWDFKLLQRYCWRIKSAGLYDVSVLLGSYVMSIPPSCYVCQFFWVASLQILLGCQSANSSGLICCVCSSVLLLGGVCSFEFLYCVNFFWLSGWQFFWYSSLHILLCCYAVSVLLGCYSVSWVAVSILLLLLSGCHFFWEATLCQLFYVVLLCQFFWILTPRQFVWVLPLCLFVWVMLCQLFRVVTCVNSSGLPVCKFFCCDTVISSGLLLYVSSFGLLRCVNFSWLSGSHFFWVASLNILLCCYAVSILLGCYSVS